jgi:hypothetical protein
MKHADWNIIPHINKRYDELKMEMSDIKDCANFSSSGTTRKAGLFSGKVF